MKKKILKFKKKKFILIISILVGLAGMLTITTAAVLHFYYGKIFPGVYIAQTNLGGSRPQEALSILETKISPPQAVEILIDSETTSQYFINLSEVELKYNLDKTARMAYQVGRSGDLFRDIQTAIKLLFKPVQLEPTISYNQDALDEYISVIKSQQEISPEEPFIEIYGKTITVNKGKPGTVLNSEKLKDTILSNFTKQEYKPIKFYVSINDPSINEERAEQWKTSVTRLIGKRIIFLYDYSELYLSDEELANATSPQGGFNEDNINKILDSIEKKYTREPQNPIFISQNGKVTEFAPSKPGVEINREQVRQQLTDAVTDLQSDKSINELVIEPTLAETQPQIKTAEVNNLGINTLIGRGTSRFKGSISSRIYNINLASSRINGHLVKPGEVFSFNNVVGDVSALTGYKQAYVIQDGKTVLGDGGGLCQVSTTMFRAALNAGLPITERRAHSYRVYYYEQDAGPGLDATVYSPTTDLKVKNDTPGYILIQTIIDNDNKTLTFELYGTDDGREATITKPVILTSTKPPDDVYVDDPSLPAGKVNQIEHSAWGAKTVFDYNVTRNGEEIYSKKFYSVYQPWAAVYMRGVGPTQ